MFLFHIDCIIYANHALIRTTIFNKRYRTHYKILIDLDTFGSDSVFVKNIYT